MIFKYFEWIRLLRDMKRYQKVDDYTGTAETNHLYRFFPEGAVSSDGSRYHGLFRTGTENRKSKTGFMNIITGRSMTALSS